MTEVMPCSRCGNPVEISSRGEFQRCHNCGWPTWYVFMKPVEAPVIEPDSTPRHRTHCGVGAVGRKLRRGK